jgi:hypothetical protein
LNERSIFPTTHDVIDRLSTGEASTAAALTGANPIATQARRVGEPNEPMMNIHWPRGLQPIASVTARRTMKRATSLPQVPSLPLARHQSSDPGDEIAPER